MKKLSGIGRKRFFKSIFRKINAPYNLYLQDEETREEILHLRMTKKNVYILFSVLLLSSFILFSILFAWTPLKYYIPGYETQTSRRKLIRLQTTIDSLKSIQNSREGYLRSILAIVEEDESFLRDTATLTDNEITRAENSNFALIDNATRYAGLNYSIRVDSLKKKLKSDSLSAKPGRELAGKAKSDTAGKKIHGSSEPLPTKKRDTIIIYK